MNPNFFTVIILFYCTINVTAKLKYNNSVRTKYNSLFGHTKVTDSLIFPYVVAILKKFSYLSAGALLDDKWVLTAADSFFALRESSRVIRVRLGSVNYKKGGIIVPIKSAEVHPDFDDSKPLYDVALLRLAYRVRLTPYLYPIRMQTVLKEVTSTHFIVTGWTPYLNLNSQEKQVPISIDVIKQKRILSVSHLHPSKSEDCREELKMLDVNDTESVMCLDPDLKSDPCWRDTGAPVVLNGVLWGIISSWCPDDCNLERGPSFVNLVAAYNISSWIHSTTDSYRQNTTVNMYFVKSIEDYSNEI